MTKFITHATGKMDGSAFKATFTSGATTSDVMCARFFMKMQDDGYDIDAVRSYANIGPMIIPDIDWNEVNRILDTFN